MKGLHKLQTRYSNVVTNVPLDNSPNGSYYKISKGLHSLQTYNVHHLPEKLAN